MRRSSSAPREFPPAPDGPAGTPRPRQHRPVNSSNDHRRFRHPRGSRRSFHVPRAARTALREFTHRDPELVFWITPEGRLLDAKRSHLKNPPPGYEHILDDEPDYGGFLRGRVARLGEHQLVAVYCRDEALAANGPAVRQLLAGLSQAPIPIDPEALLVSDNGDIYGVLADLSARGGDEG